MEIAAAVFWGLLMFSLLVFSHEAGHFLVSRLFHVRVTEFFLGMPCPARLSWRSERFGTEFGVTPILLGGYNRICGMDSSEPERCADVLACLSSHGTAPVALIAAELGMENEEVLDCLVALKDMASAVPAYADGEDPSGWPELWKSPKRDANGLTVYDDGHDFSAGFSDEGERFEYAGTANDFYGAERSHTFRGVSYPKKMAILVAGIVVNLLTAFCVFVGVMCIAGVEMPVDANMIGSVVDGSAADRAGVQAGDTVLYVDGVETGSWIDIVKELGKSASDDGEAVLSIRRDGGEMSLTMSLEEGESTFGVQVPTSVETVDFPTAMKTAATYIRLTAERIAMLFVPTETMEIVEGSRSIVGVSAMAADAAGKGIADFLFLLASVALSLGLMNLFPIPPLDGGKMLFETIGAIRRKPVSQTVQNAVAYAGIAAMLLLFVYTLHADIIRLVSGGI